MVLRNRLAAQRLAGKVALITGGSSGLGAEIVKCFSEAGAVVSISDVKAPDKTDYHYTRADVSHPEAFTAAVEAVIEDIGKLNILINNAAIQPHGIALEDTPPELLDRVFHVNSHAVFYGLQLAKRYMEKGGSVINTSSFVGSLGAPNCSSYAASKAAVDQLTRVGAMELASKEITVNAVAPGLILTPAVTGISNNPEVPFVEERTPLGRAGLPSDVAPLFEFLASDDARFITGAIIPVDGGIAAGWNRYELKAPEEWADGRWRT
ncbi:MAG: SDR family oxidoreductase [Verrucomicrobiaceae bacterium]|nr:SDR family oxidoreductase [Verrucomicrobiaceae bacterium]